MRRRDFYVLGESELGAVGKGGLFRGTTEAGGDERWSNEVAKLVCPHFQPSSAYGVVSGRVHEHKRAEKPGGSTCWLGIKSLLTS